MKETLYAYTGAIIVQGILLIGLANFHTISKQPIVIHHPIRMIVAHTKKPNPIRSNKSSPSKDKTIKKIKTTNKLQLRQTPPITIATTHTAPIIPPHHKDITAYTPQPIYPPRARRLGLEGCVTITLHVSSSGNIHQCQITHSSGHATLDDSACKTLHTWIMEPERQNGIAIASLHHVRVQFSLTSGVHF